MILSNLATKQNFELVFIFFCSMLIIFVNESADLLFALQRKNIYLFFVISLLDFYFFIFMLDVDHHS